MHMTTCRDVVIFLPGISGSTLLRNGRAVWGMSWSAIMGAILRHSLDDLTIANETGADDLGDGVEVGEVLDDVHIIPGLWKIEAYGGFCRELCATAGLVQGQNFYPFAYDWRRDNRVSARRLKAFADEKLHAWRKFSGIEDPRLILVAHSMGGLVARYYIECLEGWRSVRRLVTLGTPHLGSLDAIGYLANGYAKSIGPISVDATAPLRSFSSVYQLLPTFRCVEAAGGLQRVADVALPNLDPLRVKDAVTFHNEIRQAETANASQIGYSRSYLSAVVSSRQPTFQSARLGADGRVELVRSIDGDDHGGDGTVPAMSAVPIDFDPTFGTYVTGTHAALTNQEPVRESLIGALRAGQIDRERFRAGVEPAEVTLALLDVYLANREFTLSAGVRGAVEQTLTVEAVPLGGGEPVGTTLHRTGDAFAGPLTLGPGTWRVRVAGRVAKVAEDIALAVTADGTV
jgi:pimeloyl-ACP methyl ester carboxylesterase